ncbi:MAG: hypothetical protein U1F45_19155 [Burkholderiales bacterium]
MPPIPPHLLRRALAALLAACLLAGAPAATAEPSAPVDARITSTARLLAGIESDYPAHARIAALDAWQAHRATLAPKWERLQRGRLSVIETWRNQTLGSDAAACRALLYPFSGPDFMNAYLLFPRCDTYVMFGLEAPGSPPPFETMGADEAGLYLKDMRVALTDFLARNYFITSRMAKQLHTPRLKGVAPLVLASMGLLDVRVTAVEPFDLGPGSDEARRAGRRAQGMKITFWHPQVGKPQTLYYLSLDATDRALKANPEFLPFLAQFGPSITFLKSASYLLHGNEFAGTRAVLLDATELLVQDDTGIPYRYLRARGFEVRLYGRYARPIRDFNYGYQHDLAAAYRTSGKVADLPFPFGYHWQDGRSGLILARGAAKRS